MTTHDDELTEAVLQDWRRNFPFWLKMCGCEFSQTRLDEWEAICAAALKGIEAEWRPIETAPKDGMEILVIVKFTNQRTKAFWDTARGGVWSEWPGRIKIYPSHWMPLPAAPTQREDIRNAPVADNGGEKNRDLASGLNLVEGLNDSSNMVARNPAPHAAASLSPSPSKTFSISSSPEPVATPAGEKVCECFGDDGDLHASTFIDSKDRECCDFCGRPIQPGSTDILSAMNKSPSPPAIGDVEKEVAGWLNTISGAINPDRSDYFEIKGIVAKLCSQFRTLAAEKAKVEGKLAEREFRIKEQQEFIQARGVKDLEAQSEIASLRAKLTQTIADDDEAYQRVAKELEVANDEVGNLRAKLERAHSLFRKLLSVWEPEWEPGKSLHAQVLEEIKE